MTLHYLLEGPADAPVILFSNSLGTSLEMWQPQRDALVSEFRILRYDVPGHGNSSADGKTNSLEQLGRKVLSLLDELDIEKVHFCGISMGGLTGLWLARFHPQRLFSLTVANSAAKIGEAAGWQQRAALVRQNGMQDICEGAAARWFTSSFRDRVPATVKTLLSQLAACDAEAYAGCCEALAAADLRDKLSTIQLPVLVIAGSDDPVTTVADAKFIADQIDNAKLNILPASHLSSVEIWVAFNRALQNFIESQKTQQQRYTQGIMVRRAVLGDAHVDRTLEHLSPLNEEFQNFISRYAWGEIWTRPGLTRHTRSLITISMLVALNRAAELKMHLRAAFNNGVTRDEIKEVLMHSALYCGLPAANEALHLAQEIFDEQDGNQT